MRTSKDEDRDAPAKWIRTAYESLWPGCQSESTQSTVDYDGVMCLRPEFVYKRKPVMVRNEYRQLWEYVRVNARRLAQDARARVNSLVVTGQHGIGKTIFLLYALTEALKIGIPVVYYSNPDMGFILCNDGGCRVVQRKRAHKLIQDGTLILVDLNDDVLNPPRSFTEAETCYIVLATSPERKRWNQWTKEREAYAWVMSLWSKDEVGQLQRVHERLGLDRWNNLRPTSYTPLELFEILGPSARHCFDVRIVNTGNRPRDFAYLDANGLFQDVQSLVSAIESGHVPASVQDLSFHHFFVATRVRPNPIYQPAFRYVIPTTFLREVIAVTFRKQSLNRQLYLASQFSPFPQVAAMILKSLVLNILQESTIAQQCSVCVDALLPSRFVLGPNLTLIPGMVDVLGKSHSDFVPHDDHIYVPPLNYPSLDAFIISEHKTRVTMLQITVASKHEIVLKGIRGIIKLCKLSGLKVKSWSFLFVTPSVRGEHMAKAYKNALVKSLPDVKLGWLEIGGIDRDVAGVLSELAQSDTGVLNIVDDDVDGSQLDFASSVSSAGGVGHLIDPTEMAGDSGEDAEDSRAAEQIKQ